MKWDSTLHVVLAQLGRKRNQRLKYVWANDEVEVSNWGGLRQGLSAAKLTGVAEVQLSRGSTP